MFIRGHSKKAIPIAVVNKNHIFSQRICIKELLDARCDSRHWKYIRDRTDRNHALSKASRLVVTATTNNT